MPGTSTELCPDDGSAVGHGFDFAEGYVPGQVFEAAVGGDDDLVHRAMGQCPADAGRHLVRCLNLLGGQVEHPQNDLFCRARFPGSPY